MHNRDLALILKFKTIAMSYYYLSCVCLRRHNLQRMTSYRVSKNLSIKAISSQNYKKLSYCWETVRRKSMPRIAEMDVEMTI